MPNVSKDYVFKHNSEYDTCFYLNTQNVSDVVYEIRWSCQFMYHVSDWVFSGSENALNMPKLSMNMLFHNMSLHFMSSLFMSCQVTLCISLIYFCILCHACRIMSCFVVIGKYSARVWPFKAYLFCLLAKLKI